MCTWTDNIAVQNFVCNDLVASIWVIVPSKCSIKFELYVKSWMTRPYCCERNVGHAAGTVMIHTKCNYCMVPKYEGKKSLHNEPVHDTCCSSGGFLWFHVTNLDQQINSVSLSTHTEGINLFAMIITWIYLDIRVITNKKDPLMQTYFVLKVFLLPQLERSLHKCVTEHPGYCTIASITEFIV